jgi:TRAP-type C4-dicarboxylate transport system permease small subunit
MPGGTRRNLDRTILLLCALVSLTIAALAFMLMAEAIAKAEIEIRSLDAPRWVLFLPLGAGFALMSIEFLRLLLRGESVFASQSEQRETF